MQRQSGNAGSSSTATRRIELGWQVYDSLERPLGNVADVEHDRGQLRIDGRPVGFEYYEVPLSDVTEIRDENVYLRLQLDPASPDRTRPHWVNGAGASGAGAAMPRASAASRATTAPAETTRTTSSGWSPTIEHPNIVKVGESQARDVPVWSEDERSSWGSYAPWLGAAGLGAAGAAGAAGYYWWRQRQRQSALARALGYASGALGYAGDTLEPVYDRARERPAWAAALTAAALVPIVAYLRGSEQETTLEAARKQARDYLPFGQETWRDTATAWWESAPSLGTAASSLTESLPLLTNPRQTWRDYVTREDDADWVTWPLGAALLGMVVGALWYLLKGGSNEAQSSERISDIMTRHPDVIRPDATVFEAAALMRRLDVGAVPVCDGSRLQGMLTDRDIAVRSAAEGKDPHLTLVRDVMTNDVTWAFDDEPVERAADLMRQHQIRRLPIVSRDKRLVGIVSLGDVAVDTGDHRLSGSTLERVSEPSSGSRR